MLPPVCAFQASWRGGALLVLMTVSTALKPVCSELPWDMLHWFTGVTAVAGGGVGRVGLGDGAELAARAGDGAGDVGAVVDDRGQELGVDLRLGVAAHGAEDQPRPAVPQRHGRHQGVEGPRAAAELVAMA